jgi:hypothetical protein
VLLTAVELSEQVAGFAVPEAVVIDKPAELNDGADHPLQYQPEQQVAPQHSVGHGGGKHDPMHQHHSGAIEPPGCCQAGIDMLKLSSFECGVCNQTHPPKHQDAPEQQMAMHPAPKGTGPRPFGRQHLGALGIARISALPAVMKPVQSRVGDIGPGHRPAQQAGQRRFQRRPAQQRAVRHLVGGNQQ